MFKITSEITLILLDLDYLFQGAVVKKIIIFFLKFFSKQVIFIFWKGKMMLCFVEIALMLGKTIFHSIISQCSS